MKIKVRENLYKIKMKEISTKVKKKGIYTKSKRNLQRKIVYQIESLNSKELSGQLRSPVSQPNITTGQ